MKNNFWTNVVNKNTRLTSQSELAQQIEEQQMQNTIDNMAAADAAAEEAKPQQVSMDVAVRADTQNVQDMLEKQKQEIARDLLL